MKTPFKPLELVFISVGLTGMIMKTFDLPVGNIILSTGFLAFGISCLIESIKLKHYYTSSGKILLVVLPLLIIILSVIGMLEPIRQFSSMAVALVLYGLLVKNERSNKLA